MIDQTIEMMSGVILACIVPVYVADAMFFDKAILRWIFMSC